MKQKDKVPAAILNLSDAISGTIGASLSLMMIYPIDLGKTKQQSLYKDINSDNKQTISSIIKQVYKTEGLSGLYKGMKFSVYQTVVGNFIYFYIFSFLHTYFMKILLLRNNKQKALSVKYELLIGAIAGVASQLFTLPISLLVTKKQTTINNKREQTKEIIKEIYAEDGISGFWRGLKPSLILVVNPSINYGIFERLKNMIIRNKKFISSIDILVIGSLAKSLATFVTYPIIMAKTKMQSNKSDKSTVSIVKKVLKQEGTPGLYKGMFGQISKAVLSQVLLFLIKEKISLSVSIVIIGLYRKIIKGLNKQ